MSIYQADYDRARFYIRHAYESLLLIWASLHPLSHASRMLQLARLERVLYRLDALMPLFADL